MSRRFWIPTAAVVLGLGAFALFSWSCYPAIPEEGDNTFGVAVNQDQHDAKSFGLDSARIDSQITFRLPDGQADAVYEYLKGKYVGQRELLKAEFPSHEISGKAMSDVSAFTDSYFDTPTLDLYRNKNSARLRSRINTTNPEDAKSGRQLVQLKVTPPGQFTLRSELKYKVDPPNKVRDLDDLHPLIRMIDRELRADFKDVFGRAAVSPHSLQHIFTIAQQRRRGYVDLDGTNLFSFSVDVGHAHVWWAKGSFASVDFGLVEVAYTEATPEQRELMWKIRDAVVRDFVAHFPGAQQNNRSKYQIVLEQMMQQLPIIPVLFRIGAI